MKKIMVVDDDKDLLVVMRGLLKREGHEVRVTTSCRMDDLVSTADELPSSMEHDPYLESPHMELVFADNGIGFEQE